MIYYFQNNSFLLRQKAQILRDGFFHFHNRHLFLVQFYFLQLIELPHGIRVLFKTLCRHCEVLSDAARLFPVQPASLHSCIKIFCVPLCNRNRIAQVMGHRSLQKTPFFQHFPHLPVIFIKHLPHFLKGLAQSPHFICTVIRQFKIKVLLHNFIRCSCQKLQRLL